MPQHLPPVVFALSLTLVAVALGGLCGRATAGRAWHSRAAVVALAALLWALMTRPPLLYVGGGDLLWLWGAFALSVAAGRRATTLRWKPLLASVVFGAVLLELGARVAVPPRRDWGSYGAPQFVVDLGQRDSVCLHLMDAWRLGEAGRSTPEMERAAREGRPVVVHVGDSMVEGLGVPAEQRFVSQIGQAHPAQEHAVMARPGAGPDTHLIVVDRVVTRMRPRPALVVLYLFPGNDVHDIDVPRLCCDGLPPLRWEGDRPVERFGSARWRLSRRQVIGQSPAPWFLRALGPSSHAAAAMLEAWDGMMRAANDRGLVEMNPAEVARLPEAERWRRMERIVAAIRGRLAAQGVPALAVVIPYRLTLEQSVGNAARGLNAIFPTYAEGSAAHARFVEILTRAGFDTVDAFPVMQEMARANTPGLYARAYPNDWHFGPEGHRRLAAWLDPQIQARLRRP